METRTDIRILEKQGWHLLSLLVLLPAVYWIAQADGFLTGALFGWPTSTWLIIALAIPIVQQVFIVFAWRTQLQSGLWTRWFGEAGFPIYGVIFMITLTARPVTVLLVGLANRGTLGLPFTLIALLSLILLIPTAYLFYSVVRYFSIVRAMGADHFDPAYRESTLEKRGIYKYMDNSMYIVGFFLLWIIALLTASKAALLAALFNHLYIWAHYYFTEKPDMQKIYGLE